MVNKIGIIGLGKMGINIAHRLSNFYGPIYITEKCAKKLDKNKKRFIPLENPSKVSNSCDLLFICVNTVQEVDNILFSKNGVIVSKNKPKFIIDLSTIDPNFSEIFHKKLKKYKVSYIDSPMGRTPNHAKIGKLNLMMGCRKSDVKPIYKLLDHIAENIFFTNQIGMGNKIKLLNNFYGQSITALFNDIIKIAHKKKINLKMFFRVINKGPLYSGILKDIYSYHTISKTKFMKFSLKNAYKDLKYFRNYYNKKNNFYLEYIIKRTKSKISKLKINKSVGEL